MRRLAVLAAAVTVAVAAALAPSAAGSRFLQHGIFDDAQILFGNPDEVFPTLKQLNTKIIRVNLWWGGPFGVAKERPRRATNPNDPAYNWDTYDRTAHYAAANGIKVVYSIIGTPSWANGGRDHRFAPTRPIDLRNFARAAARRYDGTFSGPDGRVIPGVRYWIAWNEPNNPSFLRPQFRKVKGRWVIESGRQYARICNAVVNGVKRAPRNRGKVACGATAPRGNNQPNTSRASVSPLAFVRAMKRYGAQGFKAYAHHPYYGKKSETPTTPPPQGQRGQPSRAVTLGNFNVLVKEINTLYGRGTRLWVTEYGYQTNPPDKLFGVTKRKQREYLEEAYAIVKRHPRVDMFLWFLLRDETLLGGWQSGLIAENGKKKPAFPAFRKLS